jgi:transposase
VRTRLKVEDGAGLHRARDRLLVERTALINQLRGMLRAMTYFAAFPIVFM